jgi:uncharacterized repeat protein (TIGR03803 family)
MWPTLVTVWLTLSGKVQQRPAPRRRPAWHRPSFRPRLEQLENRLTPSLTTLASLPSQHPGAGLVADSSGNLYGTTQDGGAYGDGTVFELANGSSTVTTLASFNGSNGNDPFAGLIMDGSGNLYGTTHDGGSSTAGGTFPNGAGTVFELARGSGTITMLASFNGANGALPAAGLVMDANGNLYGTAREGGANSGAGLFPGGAGTVFELPRGSGTIIALASFNGTNGANPTAGLIMDGGGNLYGTAEAGGAGFGSASYPRGEGVVFELAPGSSAITTLASFSGVNGATPRGRLVMDGSGDVYGATFDGGPGWNPGHFLGYGTVFEVAVGSGAVTTLASFNGSNGYGPEAGVIMDGSGNLYGTTVEGGATWIAPPGGTNGIGSVFEVAAGSGAITTLASFNGSNGSYPAAGLITDGSGHFYSLTEQGGAGNDGTIFELTNGPSFAISGPSGVTAGTAATFTLTALNTDGTPNPGYAGTVRITSSDPQADLPGNLTISGGTGTFSVTLKTAGPQSITAADVNNPGMSGSDRGVAVSPAAAVRFVLSAPSSATHGVAFSVTLTVYDAYGNVATGYRGTVHFSSSDSTATLPANYTFTAADAGVHTFSNLFTLRKKGTQTLTVVDLANGALTATDGISVS